ncbi:putative peptidoglycan binding protein [Spongiibacter sp. IMCC21906]|nr:putative peptidoglycan binding protein [Spongiibacter sp. IMCC21906]
MACQLPSTQRNHIAAVPPVYTQSDERINDLEGALADALIQIEKLRAEQADTQPLSNMPPNAKSGSCYAKMLVPAQYVERSERRIVKEAQEQVDMLPAKMAWVEEQVMVSEEHIQLKVVPATYKWVEERTEVLPQRRKQVLVAPATYKTVVEQVLEVPEQQVWRAGRGAKERVDEETGEILHLETTPAKYRNISKQVLVASAKYRTEVIPAVFETLSKRVVDIPEHTVEIVHPATYKTVRVRRIVEPERQVRRVVPPEYQTFQYREKVADAKLDWREILCKPAFTTAQVSRLQKALKAAGYDPGYADGKMGKRTEEAVAEYQQAKGLAKGRVSIETFDALGLSVLSE